MNFYSSSNFLGTLASDAKFWVPKDRTWLLVYGDIDSHPLLLVHVTENPLTEKESEQISKLCNPIPLPLLYLQAPVSGAMTLIQNGVTSNPSDLELGEVFKQYGLPVRSGTTSKDINRQSSSSYHEWQRTRLGSSITVSDIDAILLGETNTALIEVKRSFKSVNIWTPYLADIANYSLLFRVSTAANYKFVTLYHEKIDNPLAVAIFLMTEENTLPKLVSTCPIAEVSSALDAL